MTPDETAAQVIFDKVVRHLFTQGQQSIGYDEEAPVCLYRGPNGMMCAVGALIPDEVYKPSMENIWVGRLIDKEPQLAHLKPHWKLLSALQDAHDDVENWQWTSTMRTVLHDIGHVFGLDHSLVDTLSLPGR